VFFSPIEERTGYDSIRFNRKKIMTITDPAMPSIKALSYRLYLLLIPPNPLNIGKGVGGNALQPISDGQILSE
jgi:hypothetical protein